jgi:polysaccharide deacetylase family protein (PEP-CTERM system associated)
MKESGKAGLQPARNGTTQSGAALPDSTAVILSFDVEEHYRIESAAGLTFAEAERAYYSARVAPATRWILDQLERYHARATFFTVGEVARQNPDLIRAIHRAGHELASHSWDHRRLLVMNPDTLREDVRRTKDALEQLTGAPVVGYRAPTFSLVRDTAWAVDVLAEFGFAYDSSIFPVRHDRYGVPAAPRVPFCLRGSDSALLELPPATLRFLGLNLPVGGGGYFRFLPTFVLQRALVQLGQDGPASTTSLYFHPWEFDAEQIRLPLNAVNRFRTYVGIHRSRPRLVGLLERYRFVRAMDVAEQLVPQLHTLPQFKLA